MWEIKGEHADKNRLKRYTRKHFRESASCYENLTKLCEVLNSGFTIQQAETGLGFLSSEGGDIYRIAQRGVAHAKETRLYVLVVVLGNSLYVLTIGDKDTQQRDLQHCREIAANIKKTLEEQ